MSERFPSDLFLYDLAQAIINNHVVLLYFAVANVVLLDVHMDEFYRVQFEQLFLQLASVLSEWLRVVLVLAVFHRVGHAVVVDHKVKTHLATDSWANANDGGYFGEAELSQQHLYG